MKFLKISFALILLFTTLALQAQKVAHFDRNSVVQQMPEVKKAQTDLETYAKQLDAQVSTMLEEYQNELSSYNQLIDQYQSQGEKVPASIKSDREEKLGNLEQRIQKFRQKAQQDVQQKELELLEPIVKRINDAAESVAKEKGYNYVFDTSQGSIIYANESGDITALVKQKLNLN